MNVLRSADIRACIVFAGYRAQAIWGFAYNVQGKVCRLHSILKWKSMLLLGFYAFEYNVRLIEVLYFYQISSKAGNGRYRWSIWGC